MRLHVDDSFHENVVAGALHDAGYATLMSGALLTLTPRCTAEVSRDSVPASVGARGEHVACRLSRVAVMCLAVFTRQVPEWAGVVEMPRARKQQRRDEAASLGQVFRDVPRTAHAMRANTYFMRAMRYYAILYSTARS